MLVPHLGTLLLLLGMIYAKNICYQCIGRECGNEICEDDNDDDDNCTNQYSGGYCIADLCIKITNYFTYTDELKNVEYTDEAKSDCISTILLDHLYKDGKISKQGTEFCDFDAKLYHNVINELFPKERIFNSTTFCVCNDDYCNRSNLTKLSTVVLIICILAAVQ